MTDTQRVLRDSSQRADDRALAVLDANIRTSDPAWYERMQDPPDDAVTGGPESEKTCGAYGTPAPNGTTPNPGGRCAELMTLQETAAMLRVPQATLRHWRVTGYGPQGRRIGRRVLYRSSDVTAFIDEQFAAR